MSENCLDCKLFAEIANTAITPIMQTASKLTEIDMIVRKLNKVTVGYNCA